MRQTRNQKRDEISSCGDGSFRRYEAMCVSFFSRGENQQVQKKANGTGNEVNKPTKPELRSVYMDSTTRVHKETNTYTLRVGRCVRNGNTTYTHRDK